MSDMFLPGTIVLEIPARADFVSFVRVVIAAAAELEPNLSNERIEDLKLAVSEATTNAIDAQNRGTSDARIRVEVRLADDEVTVLIHDEGPGFEPEDIPMLPEPDHPDRLLHESGLGVHLMRLLADDASITTDGHGTDVKLTVYSSRRRNSG
jgi:serine/threonine-protein kinase RsbW